MPEDPVCKICLSEECEEGDEFISPCACRGTQQYVHRECLKQWQSTAPYHRGRFCTVCLQPYAVWLAEKSSENCKPSWMHQILDFMASKGMLLLLLGALLVLAFCVKDQSGICCLLLHNAVLLLGTIWAFLRFAGVRPVHTGVGFRLIRHGTSVPGLHGGMLLVATDQIRGGIFKETVLLLTHHDSETGSTAYILNKPLQSDQLEYVPFISQVVRTFTNLSDAPLPITHGIGGPVMMGQWEILHQHREVPGCGEVVPAAGVCVGGDLADILRRTQAASDDAPGDPLVDQNTGAPAPNPLPVSVLYGKASWAPGQLEGEIRSRAWHFVEVCEELGPEIMFAPTPSTWRTVTDIIAARGLAHTRV